MEGAGEQAGGTVTSKRSSATGLVMSSSTDGSRGAGRKGGGREVKGV